jgi:hypothetical protein
MKAQVKTKKELKKLKINYTQKASNPKVIVKITKLKD